MYEWLRGPRTLEELEDQEALLPADEACAFGRAEAAAAAQMHRSLRRSRGPRHGYRDCRLCDRARRLFCGR
jgi:hypothetical protein